MSDGSRRTQVSLTMDELWHLYFTMDGIVGAGSERADDARLTVKLARALHRRGASCVSIERLLQYERERGDDD